MIKCLWGRIYGLGLAWEVLRVVSDTDTDVGWTSVHWKLFLGPLTVCGTFDVPRPREIGLGVAATLVLVIMTSLITAFFTP